MNEELNKLLADAIKGLSYVSETDAPFEIVSDDDEEDEWLTFTQFFEPLIRFGKRITVEEAATVKKYRRLRNLLRDNLTHRRVIKIARESGVEFDIYIVGKDSSGNDVKLKTFSVET